MSAKWLLFVLLSTTFTYGVSKEEPPSNCHKRSLPLLSLFQRSPFQTSLLSRSAPRYLAIVGGDSKALIVNSYGAKCTSDVHIYAKGKITVLETSFLLQWSTSLSNVFNNNNKRLMNLSHLSLMLDRFLE